MQALPVRQLPVELRIQQRWPLALVFMQEPPEEPLTRVLRARLPLPLAIPRRLLPALMRARRVRTPPSPVQVRLVLPPVLMRVLPELRVRIPDSPGIRVRQERFLERALPVVRLARPEAVRVAVPLNSKPVPLRTRC